MGQVMDYSTEAEERTARRPQGWRGVTFAEPWEHAPAQTLNARAVEFIARPGKSVALQECLRGNVVEALGRRTGFSGAVVLSSHKEERLITVLSFWRTESEAIANNWEDSRVVRQLLFQLIDVCSRVHTYEAAIPTLPVGSGRRSELLAC